MALRDDILRVIGEGPVVPFKESDGGDGPIMNDGKLSVLLISRKLQVSPDVVQTALNALLVGGPVYHSQDGIKLR